MMIEGLAIRTERPGEAQQLSALISEAFRGRALSRGNEATIVETLRTGGALTLALVAELEGRAVGHIVFSPVVMANGVAWLGLGPLSVQPSMQGKRIGSALVRSAFERLDKQTEGYVLVGDPAYYTRFGFRAEGATFPGIPDHFVLTRHVSAATPKGPVSYHPAFTA